MGEASPFVDDFDSASCEIVTYKVSAGGKEQAVTLNHATQLEKERYLRLIASKDFEFEGMEAYNVFPKEKANKGLAIKTEFP